MIISLAVVLVVVVVVQFSVQGVGSCLPGDGTSPAIAGVDRQRARREIAAILFMVWYSDAK